MKLKMWIGNYDGRRYGLIISTSKVKARAVIGRCSAKAFDDYWVLQDDYLRGTTALLKPDTLYTSPISPYGINCRTDATEWIEGQCALPGPSTLRNPRAFPEEDRRLGRKGPDNGGRRG